MHAAMLTVQSNNKAAHAFYVKLGYTEWDQSPGEEAGYKIMIKTLNRPGKPAAAAS
jgi:hypothetical protein